ncbi:hypothetical protein [Chryseobacterium oryzae]|uniref:Signal peptidase n=1 Tax=Chryseobacterium oryzae TaxID=2929799 RepID=A0ABY4BI83_9FLAO|nr:hypothetical protein [Chryseobacterium oryzae]UOE38887.1 hypothetical protein MTP08_03700 [Chryseobacterium oryzae]
MKKIILVALFAVSNFAFAQQNDSNNPYVYETQNDPADADEFPSNPGDPKILPIDDYIPVLFIIGLVIAFGVSMKKKTQITE